MITGYSGKPFTLEQAQKCVGPGWADLVRRAYESLPDDAVLAQVKEKFGGLRFYSFPETDVVGEVEHESFHVCEQCGEPGKGHVRNNWLLTLCSSCAAECGAKPRS